MRHHRSHEKKCGNESPGGHGTHSKKPECIDLASSGVFFADKLRQTIADYRARTDHSFVFTSKSVSEGHADKVCDFIADSILDAYLSQDAEAEVACNVLCHDQHVVLAGEIISAGRVDVEAITRAAIREIGYTYTDLFFHEDLVCVQNLIRTMNPDILRGIGNHQIPPSDHRLVYGFATKETPELIPLPIYLAHRLTRGLAEARKAEAVSWLRPDSNALVSVRYEQGKPVEVTDVIVSTQIESETPWQDVKSFVTEQLLPKALGQWLHRGIQVFVNPTDRFIDGGPEKECGMTGRKIAMDTYGGYARHSGGAFSGKDASKSERTTAYFARFVARQIIEYGIADCAEIQITYALGNAQPVSIKVDTRGTGDDRLAEEFARQFDFQPRAIIERFDLRKPIYRATTNYGHFGKPNLPWEK